MKKNNPHIFHLLFGEKRLANFAPEYAPTVPDGNENSAEEIMHSEKDPAKNTENKIEEASLALKYLEESLKTDYFWPEKEDTPSSEKKSATPNINENRPESVASVADGVGAESVADGVAGASEKVIGKNTSRNTEKSANTENSPKSEENKEEKPENTDIDKEKIEAHDKMTDAYSNSTLIDVIREAQVGHFQADFDGLGYNLSSDAWVVIQETAKKFGITTLPKVSKGKGDELPLFMDKADAEALFANFDEKVPSWAERTATHDKMTNTYSGSTLFDAIKESQTDHFQADFDGLGYNLSSDAWVIIQETAKKFGITTLPNVSKGKGDELPLFMDKADADALFANFDEKVPSWAERTATHDKMTDAYSNSTLIDVIREAQVGHFQADFDGLGYNLSSDAWGIIQETSKKFGITTLPKVSKGEGTELPLFMDKTDAETLFTNFNEKVPLSIKPKE